MSNQATHLIIDVDGAIDGSVFTTENPDGQAERAVDTRQGSVNPTPVDLTPEEYAAKYNLGINNFYPPIPITIPWLGTSGTLVRIDAFAFDTPTFSFCNVIVDSNGDEFGDISKGYDPLSNCPFLNLISK
jgi:hypothetical protein